MEPPRTSQRAGGLCRERFGRTTPGTRSRGLAVESRKVPGVQRCAASLGRTDTGPNEGSGPRNLTRLEKHVLTRIPSKKAPEKRELLVNPGVCERPSRTTNAPDAGPSRDGRRVCASRRRGWVLGILFRLPRRRPALRRRHLRGQRLLPPRADEIRHPPVHRHQGQAGPLLPRAPAAREARARARTGVLDQVHGAVQPLRRDRRRPRRARASQATRRHTRRWPAGMLRPHRAARGCQLGSGREHHRTLGPRHRDVYHQLPQRGERQELDLAGPVRGEGGVRGEPHRGPAAVRPTRVSHRFARSARRTPRGGDHGGRHGAQDHR